MRTEARPRDVKPSDDQRCLLLFTIKFYFRGIAAVSRHSDAVRMASQLGEMQWKSHYSVRMLERNVGSGAN